MIEIWTLIAALEGGPVVIELPTEAHCREAEEQVRVTFNVPAVCIYTDLLYDDM